MKQYEVFTLPYLNKASGTHSWDYLGARGRNVRHLRLVNGYEKDYYPAQHASGIPVRTLVKLLTESDRTPDEDEALALHLVAR